MVFPASGNKCYTTKREYTPFGSYTQKVCKTTGKPVTFVRSQAITGSVRTTTCHHSTPSSERTPVERREKKVQKKKKKKVHKKVRKKVSKKKRHD